MEWQAWPGRRGLARCGEAGNARRGGAGRGLVSWGNAGHGKAGSVRQGGARLGPARPGLAGMARLDRAWMGAERYGRAGMEVRRERENQALGKELLALKEPKRRHQSNHSG